MDELTSVLQATATAAPSLSPDAVLPIAQGSADTGAAVTTAQATAALTQAAKDQQDLNNQSPTLAAATYKTLPAARQAALTSIGYKPPAPHEGGLSGLIHTAIAEVGGAVGAVAGEAGHLAMDVVKPVASVAGAGLRAVSHAERAGNWIGMQTTSHPEDLTKGGFGPGGRDLWDPGPWKAMFSPSEWAAGWNNTEHGEQTFNPGTVREVVAKHGAGTAALAERIAGGAKVPDLIKGLNPADQQSLVTRLQSDTDLQDAVTMLNGGKLDFGRNLVGSDYMYKHPLAGKVLSGAANATFDWFDDPVMGLTKAAKGVQVARYLVTGPADVERLYQTNAGVRAAMTAVASKVAAGDASGLMEQFPKLGPLIPKMITEGVDTPEAVRDFMAGHVAQIATMRGMAAKLGDESGMAMPHLTWAGQARLAAKGALRSTIDWAADRPATIAGVTPEDLALAPWERSASPIRAGLDQPVTKLATAAGRTARAFSTLVPTARSFEANGPDALQVVRDLGLEFMPRARVNELVDAYAAADDLGLRKTIYQGLLKQMGQAADVYSNPQLADYWDKFVSTVGDGIDKRLYAPAGIDSFVSNGIDQHAGLLEQDMTDEWGIPSFKTLWAASKRASITKAIMGPINSSGVDWLMQSAWKPLTLLRYGFPIRAGGEELFGALLRDGPSGLLKSRLALSALKDPSETILPWHPISRIWDTLTGHLPQNVQDVINTPSVLLTHLAADNYRRASRNVEGRIAGPTLVEHARELADGGYYEGPLLRRIAATHGRAGGYFEPESTKFFQDGKVHSIELAPTGDYKAYGPSDTLYHDTWNNELSRLAQSGWARTAMTNAAEAPDVRMRAVADAIEGNPLQWQKSVRSAGTSDGRLITLGEVTPRQAAEDHAQRVIDYVDSLTKSPDGQALQAGSRTLADHLLAERKAPTAAALTQTPIDKLPTAVKGPEVIPVAKNWLQSAMQHEFDVIVGKPMDWMIRQPLFLHNYALSRDLYDTHGMAAALAGQHPTYLTKIVDDNGNPLRVFHGTNAEFSNFEIRPSRYENEGGGIYFSADPKVASSHATMQTGGSPNVHNAYLDIKNPYTRRAAGGDVGQGGFYTPERIVELKGQGYDGIIYKEGGANSYVVFDPQQIVRNPSDLMNPAVRHLEQIKTDLAVERAVNMTIPYIHDPEIRSQFSQVTRNLMPFWFAQEQFYKRWARNFAYAPWSFREAQLLMGGIRHSGMIHKDPSTGQDYFLYPAVGAAQDVLAKTLQTVTLPIQANFRGQIQFLSPGTERLGLPSFGPLVAVPVNAVASRFPELSQAAQNVLGQRGAGQSFLKQILPTTLTRAIDTMYPTLDATAQYNSATNQAIQMLEASGHGLPQGATPEDVQTHIERVKNWARVIFATRLIYGFSAPASPEASFDPANLHGDLATLMANLPVDQAIAAFMKLHPDANAYTVFQSKSASGAPLPATATAMQFMQDNKSFLKAYPKAGAWFIPTADSAGTYDPAAYREQLAEQLRVRKDPIEFWKDIEYAKSAHVYFDAEKQKNVMLAQVGNKGPQAAAIRLAWTQQSQAYRAANPIFASMLFDPSAAVNRSDALAQLNNALKDPTLPKGPQTDHIRTLVDGWDAYQASLAPYAGRTTAAAVRTRHNLEVAFATQIQQYVAANPDVSGLYLRVMRPQLSTAITAAANAAPVAAA